MRAALLLGLAAAALAAVAPAAAVSARSEPATVASLNVSQYTGRWFNIYQDWFTNATFQNASYCATALYEPDASVPGRITVRNFEHHDRVDGPVIVVPGYAYQTDATRHPGRLEVVLLADGASGFPAPYWVLRLGPVVDGQYDFAVVSDNLRLTLFVLARDVARFAARYEADVMRWVAANGFTTFVNKPVKVVQSGCTYTW